MAAGQPGAPLRAWHSRRTAGACIDGAGAARIFVMVVLPLLKRVRATLTIFTFRAAWNGSCGR